MIPVIVIGAVFIGYIVWAFGSSRKSEKSSKCAGCLGACSAEEKEKCDT
jgi:hypothetical protein